VPLKQRLGFADGICMSLGACAHDLHPPGSAQLGASSNARRSRRIARRSGGSSRSERREAGLPALVQTRANHPRLALDERCETGASQRPPVYREIANALQNGFARRTIKEGNEG
jgi:hypothetical protein